MNTTLIWRYVYSAYLCLGMLVYSSSLWAKTVSLPTGIQIGMDVLRPFQDKYYGQKGTQYELNTTVDCAHWVLEGDYGWGNTHWQGDNKKENTSSYYTSNGRYFRIGLNYNLLLDTPDKNMTFLGFQYAWSFFKDHLNSKVCYDSAGPIRKEGDLVNDKQSNVTARWLEVVAGASVKVWRLLYVGGTIRYKFYLRFSRVGSYIPYDVPGWGLNRGGESFGANFYLSLRIPFVRDRST